MEGNGIENDTVWTAYLENLEIVLPYAMEINKMVNGKTVITSDHGNLLGEFSIRHLSRQYGHPDDVYMINLLKVPWIELDNGERKLLTSTCPTNQDQEHDQNLIEERLFNLGYK